mmetsp:Transcript_26316/g.47529  ORF Transcript_26316/g.47529 Transcript_26316/m.47529 type:complete len:113 (+) Transcript_26316:1119-1457(+)
MTKDRIHQEATKPSKHWVEAGSGNLGQVFVKVIRCNGLPNMDIYNISTQIAPDAFACLVYYEDSIVNTAVITNTRSPVWTHGVAGHLSLTWRIRRQTFCWVSFIGATQRSLR